MAKDEILTFPNSDEILVLSGGGFIAERGPGLVDAGTDPLGSNQPA
jgi:hypothetical protein